MSKFYQRWYPSPLPLTIDEDRGESKPRPRGVLEAAVEPEGAEREGIARFEGHTRHVRVAVAAARGVRGDGATAKIDMKSE